MQGLPASVRRAAVVSLLAVPALAALSTLLQPPFVENHAQRLAELDEAGAAAWVSNAAFILFQPPMLVAFVTVAALLYAAMPRLAVCSAVLGVLATFGEAVMGGTGLVWLTLASDRGEREYVAAAWERFEGSPAMLFAVVGSLGTVLTILMLSIGLFRSRVTPRWVPAMLWAFLLLEFAVSGLTSFASYAAMVCLFAAYAGLAQQVNATATPSPTGEYESSIPPIGDPNSPVGG